MGDDISIPLENAFEFCQQYRNKNNVKMFSQCWGCVKYSKGMPERMCFYKPPTNDGCGKVNSEAKNAGFV